MSSMPILDIAAVLFFAILWIGYAPLVRWIAARKNIASAPMVTMRQRWMEMMLNREVRIADASLIGHVMSTVSFFTSITVVVIAGLLGLLYNFERSAEAASSEFSWVVSRPTIEIKLALVLIVMVYAFQSLAWSYRQLS